MSEPAESRIRIQRTYNTTPEILWELWTTKAGIESWWGPGGFRVEVSRLDLREGGDLHYTMITVDPEIVEWMKSQGLPTSTEVKLRFRVVEPGRKLVISSQIDFVPGVAMYEVATSIEFVPRSEQTELILDLDPMHDHIWTERQRMGRESELDKLAANVAGL